MTLIANTVITIGNRLDSVTFLYLMLNMLGKSVCIEMCQNLWGVKEKAKKEEKGIMSVCGGF